MLRIPPTDAEIAVLFGGWREELANCRKFAPTACNYAAARLMAKVGLRVNEACRLDLHDARWALGWPWAGSASCTFVMARAPEVPRRASALCQGGMRATPVALQPPRDDWISILDGTFHRLQRGTANREASSCTYPPSSPPTGGRSPLDRGAHRARATSGNRPRARRDARRPSCRRRR